MPQDKVIRFKGTFDIDNIISQLSNIQKNLNSLTINDKISKNFDKTLNSLIQKASKMAAEMQGGFSSQGQITAFQNKVRSLQIELRQAADNVQRINLEFSDLNLPEAILNQFKVLSSRVEETGKSIEALKTKASQMAAAIATREGIGVSQKELSSIQEAIGDNERLNSVIEEQIRVRQRKINQEINNKSSLDSEIEKNKELLKINEEQRKARLEALQQNLNKYTKKEKSGQKLNSGEKSWQTRYQKELESMEKGQDSYSLKRKDLEKQIKSLETKSGNAEKRIQNIQVSLQKIQQFFNTILGKSTNIISETDASNFRDIANQASILKEELRNANREKREFAETQVANVKSGFSQEANNIRGYANACDTAVEETNQLSTSMQQLNTTDQFFDNLKNRTRQILGFAQAFMYLRQIFQKAKTAVKELDAAFTEIAVVTDKTTSQLWESFDSYNQMAQRLGVTTVDAIKTSALYYQQGKLHPNFL